MPKKIFLKAELDKMERYEPIELKSEMEVPVGYSPYKWPTINSDTAIGVRAWYTTMNYGSKGYLPAYYWEHGKGRCWAFHQAMFLDLYEQVLERYEKNEAKPEPEPCEKVLETSLYAWRQPYIDQMIGVINTTIQAAALLEVCHTTYKEGNDAFCLYVNGRDRAFRAFKAYSSLKRALSEAHV